MAQHPPAIDAEFQLTLARRATRPARWAALGRQLERIISSLPTHRDSRSGRRNAQQVRAVLLATGLLTVVLWKSPWAPLALIFCVAALVIPVSESKRRQWRAALRARRTVPVVEREPAVLTVDDKHVTVLVGDERVRRLRRKVLTVSREDARLELKAGGKKTERILVATSEPDGEDVWLEGQFDGVADALS